ncbi:hypothetical protein ANN_25450 [Periplaneta americana]|uniref:Uncharacterized protein n=1 Tax=Periplaneta americana TaxID=6978 RepID=A0ABQ8S1D8_PERAM|nr:hypothetical protein ANN_25450 [Periplaneta americana]
MKINSMSELRRLAGVKSMGDAECPTLLDIEICSEQDDPRQRPNFGVKCKIFELDACQGIGKVCLVYLHKSECESDLKREDPRFGCWTEVSSGTTWLQTSRSTSA